MTITPEEFEAAQLVFGTNTRLPGTGYYVRRPSHTKSYEVVLLEASDRSQVPARGTIGRLTEQLRPEFILLVGTGGGVAGRDKLQLGDVVYGDYVDYPEFSKQLPNEKRLRKVPLDHPSFYLRTDIARAWYRDGRWLKLLDWFVPRPPHVTGKRIDLSRIREFLRRFTGASETPAEFRNSPKAVEGNLLSGEKIWGDKRHPELLFLLEEFDKAIVFDTESYAVARAVFEVRSVARTYHPQYCVIRGVSDMVNIDNNQAQREQWTRYAATAASAFACCVATDLLENAW